SHAARAPRAQHQRRAQTPPETRSAGGDRARLAGATAAARALSPPVRTSWCAESHHGRRPRAGRFCVGRWSYAAGDRQRSMIADVAALVAIGADRVAEIPRSPFV